MNSFCLPRIATLPQPLIAHATMNIAHIPAHQGLLTGFTVLIERVALALRRAVRKP